MARKILSWLALAICEAGMIAAFILFRGETPTNVTVLNITVSTVILGLLFIDLARPWNDEHTARLGSMGVRWTVTFLYAAAAIVAMTALHNHSFRLQLLVQGGLVALLLLGFVAVLATKERITAVHVDEKQKVADRDSAKRAWRDLLEKMDAQPGFPPEVRERTGRLVEELRYLTPTDNPEAQDADRQLEEGATQMGRLMGDMQLNAGTAEQTLAQCERLLKRRRSEMLG